MKSKISFLRGVSLLSCLLLLPTLGRGAEFTATWTNAKANGLWEVNFDYGATAATTDDKPGNWSSLAFPDEGASILDSGGNPVPALAPSYAVQMVLAAPCTLTSARSINSLNLGAAATLNLGASSTLNILKGTLSNAGSIALLSPGGTGSASLVFKDSPTATLSGGGIVRLNGAGATVAAASGTTLTQALGHQILGSGVVDVRGARLLNNGLIHADTLGGVLQVLGSNDFVGGNSGGFRATLGGTLIVSGGIYAQGDLGLVFADVGSIELRDNVTFIDGAFNTFNSSLIKVSGATLDNSTNLGVMRLLADGTLNLKGSGFSNQGLLEVLPASAGKTTGVHFLSSTALSGNGIIDLGGVGAEITLAKDITLSHALAHMIHGEGRLDAGDAVLDTGGMILADSLGGTLDLVLSNKPGNFNIGPISALNGGLLRVLGGTIDQSRDPENIGRFYAEEAIVELGAAAKPLTIIGGRILAAKGGLIKLVDTVLQKDIETSGELSLIANGQLRVEATSILNNGVLTVEAASAQLVFAQSTTLSGGGSLLLKPGAGFSVAPGKTLTQLAGHTLKGSGVVTLWGEMRNEGTIAPGNAGMGQLNFSGVLELGATSVLELEIGGSTPQSQYDVVQCGSTLTANGALNVHLVGGFMPTHEQVFRVLSAGAPIAGEFSNAPSGGRFATADGMGSFQVDYGASGSVPAAVTLSNFEMGPILNSALLVSATPGGTLSAGYAGSSTRVVGRSYSITATPAAGFVFNGWSGSVTSGSAKLAFVMAPNFHLAASFVPDPFTAALGKFSGLGTHSRADGFDSASMDMTLSKGGAFSAKLVLGNVQIPLKGTFLGSGKFDLLGTIAGKSVEAHLTVDSESLGGTITVDGAVYDIEAGRAMFTASNPAPAQGAYTVAFPPNAANSNVAAPRPQGHCWARVTVSARGAVSFTGTLADGTKVSRGGSLSHSGGFGLYIPLYKGAGEFSGFLTFAAPPRSLTGSDVSGAVSWQKPAQPTNKILPKPFDTELSAIGSFYTPANAVPMLANLNSEGHAQLSLLGGNVFTGPYKHLAIAANNKTSYIASTGPKDKVTLVFKAATGIFTGTFFHPFTEKSASYSGIILQKQNYGRGSFLGVNAVGKVEFAPLP